MDVLILLVFVSLVLVAGALLLLLTRVRGGDFEHADRLSLLPLEPESPHRGPDAGSEGGAGAGRAPGAVERTDRPTESPKEERGQSL